jgi:ABC-type dipeptide/oligopeptide/nickel transport system ATPase subunit
MVSHDTHSSLNPRKRVHQVLAEALRAHGLPAAAIPTQVQEPMAQWARCGAAGPAAELAEAGSA